MIPVIPTKSYNFFLLWRSLYIFEIRPHFVLGENRTMNDMYEGFAMDLLEKIATRCRFKYEIRIEKEYGKENPVTKQWNGVYSEAFEPKADFFKALFVFSLISNN